MGEEVFLLGFQLVPVCQVFGQINLKKTSTLYLSVLLYELPVFFPLVADDTVFHLIMFLWRAAIQYLIPTSSTVQNEACACLYIFQMSGYWMGKMTNRLGFSRSKGSSSVSERF